jgi:hypothetical protein
VRRNPLIWVELIGLKSAAHDRLLIRAVQETTEGKIDRFAARLSQIVIGDAPGDRLARSRNILAASHTTELAAALAGGCGR